MAENKAMFIYVPAKAKLTAIEDWQTTYADNIIFIGDSKEIWAKNTFYASSDNFTELQAKVNGLKYFSKVSDGTNTAQVTGADGVLKFTGGQGVSVTADGNGINIAIDKDTLVTGTTNGTIKFNGTDVAVKGLGTAAYKAEGDFATPASVTAVDTKADAAQTAADAAQTAADAAQSTADAKIASVTGSDAINVTTDANKAATVSLKLDTTTPGNVTLAQGANGLKASVEIPAATVTGVKSGEKVISLDGTNLTSTITIGYDSDTKKIQLKGIGNAVLGEIDATDFVKDGMISDVSLDSNDKLTITWNTDADKVATEIDLSKYIDPYDGANLKLKTVTKASTYTAPAANDSVDTAVGKLIKGIEDAKAAGDSASAKVDTEIAKLDLGVTSIGGKKGVLTLKDSSTDKTVGLTITDGGEIQAKLNLNTSTWDAALQNVELNTTANGSDNTVKLGLTTKASNKQTLSLTVKTQEISTATDSSNGLAMAKDVKDYVDGRMSWIVIE